MDENKEEEEYFSLSLAAGSTSAEAVRAPMRITNVPVGPRLILAYAEDGNVNIWWRDDGITRVLEKANTPSGGEWTSLDTPPASVAGSILSVTNAPPSTTGFYRLRKVDQVSPSS